MLLLQITDQITNTVSSQTQNVFNWMDKVKEMSLEYAPKLIGAFVIYILGRWLIKWTSRITRSILNKKNLDSSLQSFLTSTASVGLNILLFITIISVLGVETTSFAAILAGVGLGIGAAMNGSLGNIAGGVMILILKPFKIGDIIETGECFGIVQEIGIVNTTILTSSNKTVYLPNGILSTEVITNLSAQENLRVDLTMPISEEADIKFA